MSETNPYAASVIDSFGGTSALAKLIDAPVSTVFSWRKIGIPASRMAHLRLLASASGTELPPAESEAA